MLTRVKSEYNFDKYNKNYEKEHGNIRNIIRRYKPIIIEKQQDNRHSFANIRDLSIEDSRESIELPSIS